MDLQPAQQQGHREAAASAAAGVLHHQGPTNPPVHPEATLLHLPTIVGIVADTAVAAEVAPAAVVAVVPEAVAVAAEPGNFIQLEFRPSSGGKRNLMSGFWYSQGNTFNIKHSESKK